MKNFPAIFTCYNTFSSADTCILLDGVKSIVGGCALLEYMQTKLGRIREFEKLSEHREEGVRRWVREDMFVSRPIYLLSRICCDPRDPDSFALLATSSARLGLTSERRAVYHALSTSPLILYGISFRYLLIRPESASVGI